MNKKAATTNEKQEATRAKRRSEETQSETTVAIQREEVARICCALRPSVELVT